MMTMAKLMAPATKSAATTSRFEKRNTLSRSASTKPGARLRERRMQEYRMGHDGCADDADRNHQGVPSAIRGVINPWPAARQTGTMNNSIR